MDFETIKWIITPPSAVGVIWGLTKLVGRILDFRERIAIAMGPQPYNGKTDIIIKLVEAFSEHTTQNTALLMEQTRILQQINTNTASTSSALAIAMERQNVTSQTISDLREDNISFKQRLEEVIRRMKDMKLVMLMALLMSVVIGCSTSTTVTNKDETTTTREVEALVRLPAEEIIVNNFDDVPIDTVVTKWEAEVDLPDKPKTKVTVYTSKKSTGVTVDSARVVKQPDSMLVRASEKTVVSNVKTKTTEEPWINKFLSPIGIVIAVVIGLALIALILKWRSII